jgi:hypothetical protein
MDNVLIILTCTVQVNRYKHFLHQLNSEERKNTYVKSIKQWLDKTKFKICVVENSGYTFPELEEYIKEYGNRFEIITFNELTLPPELQHLVYNNSKGASEMYSIINAYSNTKFKQSINFVIKITGRYFIPELENFLLTTDINNRTKGINIYERPNSIIGLHQSNENRCELLGIHTKLFNLIFELHLSDESGIFYPHVEAVYASRFKLLNQDKILVCPLFEIEPTQMGGINVVATNL